MRRQGSAVRIAVLALALFVTTISTAFAEEYAFEVHNNSRMTITKILVSEDGENYGFFDIGKGIKAGQAVELIWDSSTDGEACEQYIKAVYSNGQESEPAVFDFCEEDVVLEFE